MKWWLVFPVIFLVLLQTTVVSFNFLLIFLILLALVGWQSEALTSAFLGGLMMDFSGGTGLGLSSLGYLTAVGIIVIYSRRFEVANLWFWLTIFPLSDFLFRLIRSELWHGQEGVMMAGVAVITYLLVSKLGMREEEEGIKLKI